MSFTNGSLPSLTEVRFQLQPNRCMSRQDMSCLHFLTAPQLKLQILEMVLSGPSWNGDHLLKSCCPLVMGQSKMLHLRLKFEGTGVSDHGIIHHVPVLLGAHGNLQQLDLNFARGDIRTRKAMYSLLNAIVGLQQLQRLDLNLTSCNLPDTGAFRVLSGLPTLMALHLNVSHNQLVDRKTMTGILSLVQERGSQIQSLKLYYQGTNIPEWCNGVKLSNVTMSSLTMAMSTRCSFGLPVVLRSCCPSMLQQLTLDFGSTCVGDRGGQRLGYLLMQYGALQKLDLSLHGNQIQDVGLNMILQAVLQMQYLKELFLSVEKNRITSCGLNLLSFLFQRTVNPLCVNLSDNPIGLHGIQMVCGFAQSRQEAGLQVLLCGCHALTPFQRDDLLRHVPHGICL